MLFTDADCIPATNQWLRLMQRGFVPAAGRPAPSLVLGFSAYTVAPGFLNQLIRYETLLTAAQYLSFAWRGRPYMGVGRNLAYTRACFAATKGFASHIRRLSGDDDLLVQDAVRQGQRAAVVADPAAHTRSAPAATSPRAKATGWPTACASETLLAEMCFSISPLQSCCFPVPIG